MENSTLNYMNMHPNDFLGWILLIILFLLMILCLRNAWNNISGQAAAETEVQQMWQTTWTGHEQTRTYAYNVLYQKLGGSKMNPAHRKAFNKLVLEDPIHPSQNGHHNRPHRANSVWATTQH